MRTRDRKPTAVKLQVWGGLGGQLLGIAYALYLRQYRQMRVKLFFNSGGTSRRNLALGKVLSNATFSVGGITWSVLNGPVTGEPKSIAYPMKYLTSGLWPITHRYGVITRGHLDELDGWRLSLDGYPNDFNVPDQVFSEMAELVEDSGLPNFLTPQQSSNRVAVHWRLGDYLDNSFHGVISPASIREGLDLLRPGWKSSEVSIFTDSPGLVRSKAVLSELGDVHVESSNIWTDMKSMSSYGAFLGSHSLISQWVALSLLRRSDSPPILLPNEWFARPHDEFFVSPTPEMKKLMKWTPVFLDSGTFLSD